ncbi:hypothetical protein [Jannaschia marina]|uniref:hypothetical protein n=1 Tax=Jannaschia marina TaxID=2741674 RepID=UPI0015C8E4F8|nr:hypothetical protein [Jannaschia marina]
MKKSLAKIAKIPRSASQIAKLPPQQAAFLGVLDYAVSEINIAQRLFLLSCHEAPECEELKIAVTLQQNLLIRLSSSKIFEVYEETKVLSLNSSDQSVKELSSEFVSEFDKLSKADGYQIARAIRHESTNHYSTKAASKNMDFLLEGADASLYVTDRQGNGFYPFGDALMFDARLNRHGGRRGDGDRMVKCWLDWASTANRALHELHGAAFVKLWLDRYPTRKRQMRNLWVEPELTHDFSPLLPVYLHKGN